MATIRGGKNAKIGIEIAKQKSKGAPKDGNFRDVEPISEPPNCPYTNPAKADGTIKGTPTMKGKLGSN